MFIKKEIPALIALFCLFFLLFHTVGCKKDDYTSGNIQGENESEIIQEENESEIPLPEDCPQGTHYCPISNSCVPDSTIEQGLQSKLECPYITLSWDKDEKAISYEIIPFYDENKDEIEDGKCEEDISNTKERYFYYNLESSDCAAYYTGNVKFQIIPQYSDGLSIDSYNTNWIDVSECTPTPSSQGETQEYEPIVFALNKKYSDKTPDWKERADSAIDTINKVFSKTTQKKYKISKYLVYEDYDYESTWYDPNFHIKLKNIVTTTIIHLVHKDGISSDELLQITPSNIVNAAMDVNIEGIKYHNILIAEYESRNMLLNKGELDDYEKALELTMHELGHTNGLAYPDWYLYSYIDCTDTEPLLPKYDIREVYPKDPMTSSGANEHEFNSLNSKIINMNLDHKYGFSDISNWYANISKVYVTDSENNPIGNAKVKVFCIRKNCFYCSSTCNDESGVVDSNIPEEVLYTDSSGFVEYEGPSGEWDMTENENTKCLVKAIKVYYQGKTGAKYTQFLDLQEDYILYNKKTHIDHITLE